MQVKNEKAIKKRARTSARRTSKDDGLHLFCASYCLLFCISCMRKQKADAIRQVNDVIARLNNSILAPFAEESCSEEKCQSCINCFRTENCGKCSHCNASMEPCLKRICLQSDYWKNKQQAFGQLIGLLFLSQNMS